MKWVVSVDIYFEIETNTEDEICEKAWEYIHNKLPKVFNTEGSELALYNLDEESEDE